MPADAPSPDRLVRGAVAQVAGPHLLVQDYLYPDHNPPGLPVATGPNPVWQSFPPTPHLRQISLQAAASELRSLLSEAVLRTVGNRAVVATLSSGMDSSAVVAVSALNGIDVTGVTWSTPSVPTADESQWAHLTAGALGIPIIDIPVESSMLLPDDGIKTRRESPLFNMFEGAWAATGHAVTDLGRSELITGYGGDLIMSGWVTPTADLLLTLRWIQLQGYLRDAARKGIGYRKLIRSEIVGRIGKQAFPSWWVRRQEPVAWLHPAQADLWSQLQLDLIGPGILPGLAERRQRLAGGSLTVLADNSVLSDMGITQIHPLLDAGLIEFALSLPTWLLYDGGLDKLVLREAMRGILPDKIVSLEKILPGDLAISAMRRRQEPLLDLARNMKAADMEIVTEKILRSEVESFMRGDHDNMAFWNALTLEDWLRRWW